MRAAPVLRQPLRKAHDGIICAALDGDWAKAERIFKKAPAVYQGVTMLLACWSKLTSGKRKPITPSERTRSAMEMATRRWKACTWCCRYIELSSNVAADPQPAYVGELLTIGGSCVDCAKVTQDLLDLGCRVEFGVVYAASGKELGTLHDAVRQAGVGR